MQITIGEYTTRNGCRAVVDLKGFYSGVELFRGFAILPGGLTKVCAWWDLNGLVRFPIGVWIYKGLDFTWTFVDKENRIPGLIYSEQSHRALTSNPSPFDITGPKQMKEETKPVLVQPRQLIKLPSGDWLRPEMVNSISVQKKFSSGSVCLKDRVVISATGINSTVVLDSLEEAQKLADDLAEKVNSIK